MHNWFELLITIIACVNFLLLIVMVFLEKRKPQYIIAWLTVITFLPIIGFGLYVIFGSGLSVRTRRMIRKKSISEFADIELVEYHVDAITGGTDAFIDVIVKLQKGDQIISARGTEPDIINASVKAYIAGVNRLIS